MTTADTIRNAILKAINPKGQKPKRKAKVNPATTLEDVFVVHELALHIASYFSIPSLLSLQRVSRLFHFTLHSPSFLRLLYQHPSPPTKSTWHLDLPSQKLTRTLKSTATARHLCVPNPMIFKDPDTHQARLEWGNFTPSAEVTDRLIRRDCPILHLRPDFKISDLNRPPLRDMFLTQPPVTRLMVCWRWTSYEYWMSFNPIKIIRFGGVYNPDGLRARDLFECIPFIDSWDGDKGRELGKIDVENSEVAIDHGFEMWEGEETRWFAVSGEEREVLERVQIGTQVRVEREARRWISYWY